MLQLYGREEISCSRNGVHTANKQKEGVIKGFTVFINFYKLYRTMLFLDTILFNVVWAQCKIKNNVHFACLVQHTLIRPLL